MGTLWVARNLTTEAEVAIKVLRSHREDDGHAAERFRHEARVGATLAHRNITRVFDLLEDDDGSLVLVMELLHGATLEATYKESGALSSAEAVAIIVPILGALEHAHEHGVIHRDVKPSNIFLHVDPDGHTTPKLLDFGIAKTHDASVLTRTGDALGSPSYMAPEQVRASKQLDGRSDLFSVGVVLYEIITGANPFSATSPTAVLAQVLELEIDPDPRIEPKLWLEIQRALSKQAYERHPSAADLADALARAVGLSPVESLRRPKTPPASAGRPAGVPALARDAVVGARGSPARENSALDPAHDASDTVTVRDAVASIPAPRMLGAAARPRLVLGVAALLFVTGVVLIISVASRARKPTTASEGAPMVLATSTPEGAASEEVDELEDAEEQALSATSSSSGTPAPHGAGVLPTASGGRTAPSRRAPTKRRVRHHAPPATRPAPAASGPPRPIARTPGF